MNLKLRQEKRGVSQKRSNSALRKGKRFEYRIRDLFRKSGFEAERVPVSGSARAIKGDVVVKTQSFGEIYIECKRRTGRFKELREWLRKAEEQGCIGVVFGWGRERPAVVLYIDKFIELLKGGKDD